MEILKSGSAKIEAFGKCAIVSAQGITALVIADLHIGYEDAIGVAHFQLKEMKAEIEKALDSHKPDICIIAGDLKHEFGRISAQEWRETISILDLPLKKTGRVVLVKGNHDKILGPIAGKKGVELTDEFRIGDALIIHGNALPKNTAAVKTIIMGHEHPAVKVSDGIRSELFKCFLIGKYLRLNLIVLPSFSTAAEGTNVLNEKKMSPLLKKTDISKFRAVICAPDFRNYDFGNVSEIAKLSNNI
jgi:putative SbcD/Mre11-related phosphoesterase